MQIQQTDEFAQRLRKLKDIRAQSRILVAVERMRSGNFGDSRPVGEGVIETRLHCGPGYRIYFVRRGSELVVLLLCGNKASQASDIELARTLAKSI